MMPKTNVANHLHRYKKVDIARKGDKEFLVYKCTKPICSHYIRMDLVEGKMCECNRCGEPMIITKETLTHSSGKPMSKPHCGNCVKRKKSDDIAALADFVAKKVG
jgi:hypothetical protein